MLGDPHIPNLIHRADGRWMVDCPQCRAEECNIVLPVGIGRPISNKTEAEDIAQNHAGLRHHPPRQR